MMGLALGPRVEDGAERAEQIGQVSGLLFQQRAEVRAFRVCPLRAATSPMSKLSVMASRMTLSHE